MGQFKPRKVKRLIPKKIGRKLPAPPKIPTCPIFQCWSPLKVVTHIVEGKRELGEIQGAKYEKKTHYCSNCGWGGGVFAKKKVNGNG